MENRLILAFSGPKGCGKSTAAKCLIEKGFTNHFFAKPLKKMLECLGVPWENLYGSKKEEPCEQLGGKSARWALQSLGTEWGRNLIHSNIWTMAWANTLPKGRNIVCDDVRFPNEYDMLTNMGGYLVEVQRPGYEKNMEHESELHVLPYDFLIINDGTEEDLLIKINDIYNDLMTKIA